MGDYKTTARDLMKGRCRVCPVCNGRACVGEVPGMGGLGTGASFQSNFDALAAVKLNMTALHEVKVPDTATAVMGIDLAMPVMAAPIGGVCFNMMTDVPKGHGEEDYVEAVLAGCEANGILGCTGDGVPPFIIDAAVKGLAAHKGIPFIKPWEGAELFEKIDRVAACSPAAIGMDIDAAGLVTLRVMGRPVTPMNTTELARVAAHVHEKGCKFIVKGIMTPADAVKAARAGCDGIVVSNHGGRILDHTPGAAEVLPVIAAAVRGKVAILADGAVRTGTDVLKLVALGADAVLIGRPVSVAAVGGGTEGVTELFATIKAQFSQAMLLTGCGTVRDISPSIIYGGRAR